MSTCKLKLRLKNTIIDKTLTYASETWTLTKRDRKQLDIFERNGNEKENCRILTSKEIYRSIKKTHYNRDNKVRLGLGIYREWKKIEFPKKCYI